jgi:hypothetical protein
MRVREEEFDKEQVIRVLYQDCLAVNVLPAPFYLEKVAKLFEPTTCLGVSRTCTAARWI